MSILGDFNILNDIASSLYSLPVKVQFCHHLTSSYSAHKALDETYSSINDLKDGILEKLMGYSNIKFNKINIPSLSSYTEMMNVEVANEIMAFGSKLEKWAAKNSYCDIENLAQEYSGVGAKLKYLLTLK